MVYANREDGKERDETITKTDVDDRDAQPVEEEARGEVVKVTGWKEMGYREKDSVESEIAVATFAELVLITSRLR